MLHPQVQTWRAQGKGDGVLVASDITLEWMLPWWWKHYSKHNNHPVAFVDFGMSREMKEWCREKGEFIPLILSEVFVAEEEEVEPHYAKDWEKTFGNWFWPSRKAWFKKPFACLQSPFFRTIWLDLDCEVRGPLNSLFSFANNRSGISLRPECFDERPETIYNSGVIPFRHGCPLIERWASECFVKNHKFTGDQDILSHIIAENKIPIGQLPKQMNWSRCYGQNPNALIYHRHGPHGHTIIRHQILAENEVLKQW